MNDAPLIKLHRLGKDKTVFIIQSLSIEDPDCDHLVKLMDDLQDIISELAEYLRETT